MHFYPAKHKNAFSEILGLLWISRDFFLFNLSDRPGVQQHSVIDVLHENLAMTLKSWIDCKRTGSEKQWVKYQLPLSVHSVWTFHRLNLLCFLYASSLLYPKVMSCLTEMRTMNEEYSKQVLHIQDIQPDVLSPLIMEVVSKDHCNDL